MAHQATGRDRGRIAAHNSQVFLARLSMIQESFGRCLWRIYVPKDQAKGSAERRCICIRTSQSANSSSNHTLASQETAPILQHHAGRAGDVVCDLPMTVSNTIAYHLVCSDPSRSFLLYPKDLCLGVTNFFQASPVRYPGVLTSSIGSIRKNANRSGHSALVLVTNGYMHLCSKSLRFHRRSVTPHSIRDACA